MTIDDFLIEVAVTLGVTQVELETGYYMVDLLALMKTKGKQDASNRLQNVSAMIATNNRGLDDAEYKTFIRNLNNLVGIKEDTKFNRDKFEELRAFTGMGGNKAR